LKVQEINIDMRHKGKKPPIEKKKIKRKFRWLKFILILILSGSAIVYLALSPLFNITAIEVQGNQYYKKDDIAKITDITIGNNGFKTIGGDLSSIMTLRYRKSEKKIISSLPYLKDVVAKFVLPNKVVIYVNERKPLGLIQNLGTNLIIDEEKYVLDTIDNIQGSKLPLIKGVKIQHYEVGQELKSEDPENLDLAVKLTEAVNDADKDDKIVIAGLINYIDVSDGSKVYLLIDSRISVNFGNLLVTDSNQIDYKIRFLKQILTNSLNKEAKGFLDFSSGDNPKFLPEN
jgi:cell division protein FtsQ